MATSHMMVGGGAEHPVEMVRRWIYAGEGGAEGVVEPGDLLVRPLATTGGGVRVAIGSGFMRSRSAGAVREMYMGSVVSEEVVPIPPNEGDQVRHDLIVMRVRDPYWQGSPWPAPPVPATAQYVYIDRIPSVAANTTRVQEVVGHENDTAIALARVDMQPGTSVLQEMIVDLRKVARPRSHRVVRAINLTHAGSARTGIADTRPYPEGGQTWPAEAENAGILDIEIPDWATHMVYAVTWSQLSVLSGSGNAYGQAWLQVGSSIDPDVWRGQAGGWDVAENAGSHTPSIRVADTVAIPERLRGKTKRFYPRATRNGGVTAGTPHVFNATSFDIDVTFEQRAV